MLDEIEQGTIIYGIRSKKYAECPSYAVIISARCDIANSKIGKLYYLTAVDAVSWFVTNHGFHVAYNEKIKRAREGLTQTLQKYRLNAELLLNMPLEDGRMIIDSIDDKEKQRKAVWVCYENTYRLVNENIDIDYRKQIVKNDNKPIINFLSGITQGNIYHYFYIPKHAYFANKVMHEGLIVDLQEIGILEFDDAERIGTPGIDYKILEEIEDEAEKKRLLNTYWLNDEKCFVAIEATIYSPWCELLMQRFSNDFIRIGVDGAGKNDFIKLAEKISVTR